jgi:hypothetical protein
MDVPSRLREFGKSDRALAQLVHGLVARARPRGRVLPATSIAPKLGLLRRGVDTWWRNPDHADYLTALADLLRCNPDDLVGASAAPVEPSPFLDFPELPAAAAQSPAPLYRGATLGDLAAQALDARRVVWLIVPDGGGKSLAVRHATRARPDLTAATVRTLAQAEAHLAGDRPLLLEVERPAPLDDDRAAAALPPGRSAVCVLAPFDPPAALAPRFLVRSLELGPDWRARMLAWANAHLDELRRIDAERWTDWLEAFDPDDIAVRTPGDLLALLACASRQGVPTNRTRLETLARSIVAGRCAALGREHRWLGRFGEEGFSALVRARFEGQALRRPLAADAWAQLLPAAWAPTPEPTRTAELIDQLANEQEPKARERARADLVELHARAAPSTAIEQMRRAGLLATARDGALEPSPVWVRDALERACAEAMLGAGDPARWGTPSADLSRRAVVDAALDKASPPVLVRLAREVTGREAAALGEVAATEALFAAVGRRLLRGWRPKPEQTEPLQKLGQRQWSLLSALPSTPTVQQRIPLTRRLDHEDNEHCARWHTEAWAFTVGVPVPEGDDAPYDWRFAGWRRALTIADLAVDLPVMSLPMSPVGPDSDWHASVPRGPRGFPLTPSERRVYLPLTELALELLGRASDEGLPVRVPLALQAPAVLVAQERGWVLTRSLIEGLLGSRGLDLLFALRPETHGAWKTLGPWLWAPLGRDPVGGDRWTLEHLWGVDRRLFDVVAAHLPIDELLAACPTLPGADVIDALHVVRPAGDVERLLRAHLEAAINEPSRLDERVLRALIGTLDERDLDVLARCASDGFALGLLAAARVWEIDGDRATCEARGALEVGDDTRLYAWLVGAPDDAWSRLLDLLAMATSTPATLRWLAERISVSGPLAPRMFEVWRARRSNPG